MEFVRMHYFYNLKYKHGRVRTWLETEIKETIPHQSEGLKANGCLSKGAASRNTWLGFLTFTAETMDQRGILLSTSPRLKACNGVLILLESVGVGIGQKN